MSLPTAEAPAQPLVLSGAAWAAILKNPKPAPVVETSCEVPGNDTETLVTVAVRHGAFHVRRESRPCPKGMAAPTPTPSDRWPRATRVAGREFC